jgi:hypothetical protein
MAAKKNEENRPWFRGPVQAGLTSSILVFLTLFAAAFLWRGDAKDPVARTAVIVMIVSAILVTITVTLAMIASGRTSEGAPSTSVIQAKWRWPVGEIMVFVSNHPIIGVFTVFIVSGVFLSIVVLVMFDRVTKERANERSHEDVVHEREQAERVKLREREQIQLAQEIGEDIDELEMWSQHERFRQFGTRAKEPNLGSKVDPNDQHILGRLNFIREKLIARRERVQLAEPIPGQLTDRLNYAIGLSCSLTGKTEESIASLSAVAPTDPEYWRKSRFALAVHYVKSNDREAFTETCAQLDGVYPDAAGLAFLKGLFHSRNREFSAAELEFRASLVSKVGPRFFFGDPRIRDGYAKAMICFCRKARSPSDFKKNDAAWLAKLDGAVDDARQIVIAEGDFGDSQFFVNLLSMRQFIADEVVGIDDYTLLQKRCSKQSPLSDDDRLAISRDVMSCIKESMQLLGQSRETYLAFEGRGGDPSRILAVFKKIKDELPVEDASLDTPTLICELEILTAIANQKFFAWKTQPTPLGNDDAASEHRLAEDAVSELLMRLATVDEAKYWVRLAEGMQSMRQIGIANRLQDLKAATNAIENIRRIVDAEKSDPSFPPDSPYLEMFRKLLLPKVGNVRPALRLLRFQEFSLAA